MIFLFDFTLFVIDIHHIMLISLFPTPFDHFHFHPTLGLDPALILTLRPNPFSMCCLFRLKMPPMEKKLDSESNEKEGGEYIGVVVTHVNANP